MVRWAEWRVAVLLVAAALVGGCSNVKLVYGFADNVIESRAERYLKMDDATEAVVEAETANLMAWHRTQMLPRYASFLETQADVAALGRWSRDDVAGAFAGFRTLMDETVAGASVYFARVLAKHTSPERLSHLRTTMAAYIDEERQEEAASEEDRLADRVERRVRNLERFVGALRDDQIDIVRRHTAPTLGDRLRWLAHLEKRQDALVDYLQKDPGTDLLAAFVHRLTVRGFDIVDPGYGEISEARWRRLEDLYADILASLNDEQRDTLVYTLRAYAADMRDLSAGT